MRMRKSWRVSIMPSSPQTVAMRWVACLRCSNMEHRLKFVLKAVAASTDGTCCGFTTLLAAQMAQPEKQVNTSIGWLRVVRLSLALPSSAARDTPSLSRHPHYYGMESASPGRLSFHASTFASVPDVSELPPRIRCPLRAGAHASSAQAAITASPKPIEWIGRPHYPAAFRAADST